MESYLTTETVFFVKVGWKADLSAPQLLRRKPGKLRRKWAKWFDSMFNYTLSSRVM